MTSLKVAVSQLVFCVLLGVTGTNGKPPKAIIGGSTVADNEFPYQASLRRDGKHMCGGSIIDETHILTAAHCLEAGNLLIDLVTVVTSTNRISFGGKSYGIKSITLHPMYTPTIESSWKNDLAIITLNTAIVMDTRTQPIKLPKKNVAGGERAVASGWGNHRYFQGPFPDELRKLDMTLLGPGECSIPSTGPISDTHLCAVSNLGSGICSGDSGGPLMSNGVLVGVTSFVVPCAMGYPDVFTRVYSYVNWINDVIRDS